MQADFHYYGTYCAAAIAGFSHEECMDICYSAQLVDMCSPSFLSAVKGPKGAATTMLQHEMLDARVDVVGLWDITKIWASFHFLPYDLDAAKPGRTRRYMNKYRLICGPDGALVKRTIELAKGEGNISAGIAMHVIADTWAHRYFAGTPSLVINNTVDDFYELIGNGESVTERKVRFRHNPTVADDLEEGIYTNSIYQRDENSIMNTGHGRAGHLPDYSFIRYRYMPAWNDYRIVIKDNPADYLNAFCQMITALKYLRGDMETFDAGIYDYEAIEAYGDRINGILTKRCLIASDEWRQFAQELTGREMEDFDPGKYKGEYTETADKESTFLGQFINAALRHKSMVSTEIAKRLFRIRE